MSYFIQILPVRELILLSQEVTPHQSRSGEGKVLCTVLNVTATTRKSVCWQLKKHPNLTTVNFVLASSWLSLACLDEAMDNPLASLDTAEDRARGGSQLSRA